MRHLDAGGKSILGRRHGVGALRFVSLTGLLIFGEQQEDQPGWNKEREEKVERIEIKEAMVLHRRALGLGQGADHSPNRYISVLERFSRKKEPMGSLSLSLSSPSPSPSPSLSLSSPVQELTGLRPQKTNVSV